MGVYIYCTKPSHVATAIVEIEGVETETEVALYRYAYKPSFSWHAEKWNAEMRFASGATACAAAYARSDKSVPPFGVNFDDERMEVEPKSGVFLTRRSVEVYDDEVKYVGRIVRWVRLPKGVRLPVEA